MNTPVNRVLPAFYRDGHQLAVGVHGVARIATSVWRQLQQIGRKDPLVGLVRCVKCSRRNSLWGQRLQKSRVYESSPVRGKLPPGGTQGENAPVGFTPARSVKKCSRIPLRYTQRIGRSTINLSAIRRTHHWDLFGSSNSLRAGR